MDVLLINPPSNKNAYQSLSDNLVAVEPPIWAGLIAKYLQLKNFEVAILDAEALNLTIKGTTSKISSYKPRLIIIAVFGHHPSASTQNMYATELLCKSIKEEYPESKILLVGGHVSALPKKTILDSEADFVCQGEGPLTALGLLSINLYDECQYAKVPGLWYKKDNQAIFTYPSAVIPQDKLSTELPGIAFDLLPMEKYRAHNWHCFGDMENRQPYAALYTSLGCPFNCSFCCINAPFGKPNFRYWEPEFIIKQFDLLVEKYSVKNIKIADEMFVLYEKHFLEICKLLKERAYNLNIWAYARVDTVKNSHLELLKAAGVNWLALGIESGSKYVRSGVTKGNFGLSDIRKVVKHIHDAGINVMGNFIFGLPDDNFNTMEETLSLAMDLNCEMANFYCAMAYPGSKLYEEAIQQGWQLPDLWLGYAQHSYETLPLPTKQLKAGEVLSFRDDAWNRYFTNPPFQQMIYDKFGDQTLDHIKDITEFKLKRKHGIPIK